LAPARRDAATGSTSISIDASPAIAASSAIAASPTVDEEVFRLDDATCTRTRSLAIEGTELVITFDRSPHYGGGGKICRIQSGSSTLYPYACKNLPASPLCGAEADARQMREKGCDLVLRARADNGTSHRFLLSGECHGNTMCWSFGYWLLSATPTGVVASPPLTGCYGGLGVHMDWKTLTFTPGIRIDGKAGRATRYDAASNRWRER
jgi:hypothetical protein